MLSETELERNHTVTRKVSLSVPCSSGWSPSRLTFMPTILRQGPYRVYFYSHEPNEPPHVHVDRDDRSAKFWLEPVELARNLAFPPVELARIRRMLISRQQELLKAWYEHFGY